MRRPWQARFASFVAAALLGLAWSGTASACLKAAHTYRFVLGSARGGIVVLQLDWRREEGGPRSRGTTDGPPMWRGPARVGLWVEGQRELREVRELGILALPVGRTDDAPFREPLQAGLRVAKAYPDFKAVGLPRYHACDFGLSCARARLQADPSGLALSISRGKATTKVALAIPSNAVDDIPDASRGGVDPSAIRMMSIVSYDVAGREVLVVDLGDGDVEHSSAADAFWPPCGCREVAACPPVAPTMLHGSQFAVVVPLSTPFSSSPKGFGLPPIPAASPATVSVAALRIAEHQHPWALRQDGIYVGAPTCSPQTGWSRHVLRAVPDGTVVQSHGNVTVAEARRLLDNGHIVLPQGRVSRVGNHLTAKLNFDSSDEPGWPLDLVLARQQLGGQLGSPDGTIDHVLLQFVPVTWDPKPAED